MLADLCPNVFIDTSSSNRWMRYEGLDLRTVFQRTLDVTGPDRLLFGSDSSFFPRGWHGAIFEQQTKTLYELGIDVQQVSKILRFNLENVHSERVSVGIT
jgi:predicted TIM-barrel fold metal-dependent hydrolase